MCEPVYRPSVAGRPPP
ncbi:hypothetical protein YPPY76_0313, partial [Yersinia pestis PY-76]